MASPALCSPALQACQQLLPSHLSSIFIAPKQPAMSCHSLFWHLWANGTCPSGFGFLWRRKEQPNGILWGLRVESPLFFEVLGWH